MSAHVGRLRCVGHTASLDEGLSAKRCPVKRCEVPAPRKARRVTCLAVSSRSWELQDDAVPSRLRRFAEEAEPSDEDPTLDAESRECALAIGRVAWDTKAEDISILHVAPLVYWCSYMVLLNAKSRPQLQALVAKIEKEAGETWGRRIGEGPGAERGSSWEVLDFQDVVVHIFTPEQREFYDLDGYYGLAEEVELPFLSGPQAESGLQWSRAA